VAQEIYDKAQPFIKWLKEAEEEESDSEEEEIEVVYDDRIRPDKIIQVEEEKPKVVESAPKMDDDIDIDAI
jgi:translation initiation factor 5